MIKVNKIEKIIEIFIWIVRWKFRMVALRD